MNQPDTAVVCEGQRYETELLTFEGGVINDMKPSEPASVEENMPTSRSRLPPGA